jgi:hypothetical protein
MSYDLDFSFVINNFSRQNQKITQDLIASARDDRHHHPVFIDKLYTTISEMTKNLGFYTDTNMNIVMYMLCEQVREFGGIWTSIYKDMNDTWFFAIGKMPDGDFCIVKGTLVGLLANYQALSVKSFSALSFDDTYRALLTHFYFMGGVAHDELPIPVTPDKIKLYEKVFAECESD